jgi:hypothetical protein
MASMLKDYNVGPLVCERAAAPVKNARGGHDESIPTVVTLNPVAVHDLSSEKLMQMPDADRKSGMKQFYTGVRLFSGDEGLEDVVIFQGRHFRITMIEDYNANGGVYISYGALRQ